MRIAANKEAIRRRHSLEKPIVIGTKIANELQLVATQPATRPDYAFRGTVAPPIRDRFDSIAAQKAQGKPLNVRDVETVIERHSPRAEVLIKMQCGLPEDACGAAADVTDRRIGHGVADLMRGQVIPGLHTRNGISGIVPDETLVAVEGQADVAVAVGILKIFPAEVFDRSWSMKTACEEVEDRCLITRLIGACDEPLLTGHASVPPTGWREHRSVILRAAWR